MKTHPLYDLAHAMVEYEIYTFLWDNINGAKTPLTDHGHRDATIDHDVMDRMLARAPRTAKLGYDNGRSEILVSDIDVAKNGNPDGLTALEEAGFVIPADAFFLETPSGGLHFPMQTLSKLPARALNYLVPNHDRLGARGWTGFYGTIDDLDEMMGNLLEAPDWMLQDTGADYIDGPQYATKEEFDDWAELHDDGEPSKFGVLFRMVQKLPAELNGNEALYSKWVLPMVGAATRGAVGGTQSLLAVKQAWNHPHHGKNGNEWADSQEFPRAVRRAIKATENDVDATDVRIGLLAEGVPLAVPPKPREPEAPLPGQVDWDTVPDLLPGQVDWDSLDDHDVLVPTIGIKTDGHGLFYKGMVNSLTADPEMGKSWVALTAAADVLAKGGTVVWLDFDYNGPHAMKKRLTAIGAWKYRDRFKLLCATDRAEFEKFAAEAFTSKPDLAVYDSMTEFYPLMGANSNSSDDVATVNREWITPMATHAGAAVIVISHMPATKELRDKGYSGAAAQKSYIDGAMYEVKSEDRFNPRTGGRSVLIVTKDRHGGVREHLKEEARPIAATFELSAPNSEGLQSASFVAPSKVEDVADVTTTIMSNLVKSPYEKAIRTWLDNHPGTQLSDTEILRRIQAGDVSFPGPTSKTRELLKRIQGEQDEPDILGGTD